MSYTVFLHFKRDSPSDYFKKSRKLTGEHYAYLLDQLDEKIHESRPGLQKKTFMCIRPQRCFGTGKLSI